MNLLFIIHTLLAAIASIATITSIATIATIATIASIEFPTHINEHQSFCGDLIAFILFGKCSIIRGLRLSMNP